MIKEKEANMEYDNLAIIKKEFEKFPPSYNLVVDVGASGNYSAASLLTLNENWSGLLFEPDPRSYNKLVETYKNNKKVVVLNKAVSNREGTLEFLLHPEPTLSSLEPNTTWYKADTKLEKIEIEVVKLGAELSKQCIPQYFDFLKIDAEGFDYRILENMFIESGYRPRIIMHEIQHPGPAKFEELLKSHGYELVQRVIGNMIYRRK